MNGEDTWLKIQLQTQGRKCNIKTLKKDLKPAQTN